jgi:protein gp37
MAKRLAGRFGYPADDPFRVVVHPEKLEEPLRWVKPARVFVNSMGDIFHEDVPEYFIDKVNTSMMLTPHITYIILTKRPKRMLEYMKRSTNTGLTAQMGEAWLPIIWPLPNVWLGVTAENQAMADERIPLLLQTPAAVRFVSVEPMLGAMDIQKYLERCHADRDGDCNHPGCPQIRDGEPIKTGRHCPLDTWPHDEEEEPGPLLDWVICGGETGPGARPMHPDWVRSLRDQCQAAGVRFFFKGWGEWRHDFHLAWSRHGVVTLDGEYVDSQSRGYTEKMRMSSAVAVHRSGKKKSGRMLDGQEWSEFPNPPSPPSRRGA